MELFPKFATPTEMRVAQHQTSYMRCSVHTRCEGEQDAMFWVEETVATLRAIPRVATVSSTQNIASCVPCSRTLTIGSLALTAPAPQNPCFEATKKPQYRTSSGSQISLIAWSKCDSLRSLQSDSKVITVFMLKPLSHLWWCKILSDAMSNWYSKPLASCAPLDD